MQDKKFDLGSNKFITVQDFKGKPLIHIREYYKDKVRNSRSQTKG